MLALAGLFVSTYLLLYKLGVYGNLACGAGGSCAVVQASRYADFLGLPVAGWGAGWYAAVLALALAGTRPARVGDRGIRLGLGGLAAAGLAFTLYLTWVELFVLRAICAWCVASAALTLAIFGLVAWGWVAGSGRDGSGGGSPGGGGSA